MDLIYYETRLIYDLSRDCSVRNEPLRMQDFDATCERTSEAVSSSITQLLLDISVLFEDENEGDCDEHNKDKPAFDLLHFTEQLLKRTREEMKDCMESMVALANLLQNLKDTLTSYEVSAEILIEESDRLHLKSCDAISSSNLWLRGAEEKLKLHTFQLIRETYLSEDSIIPALKLVKDKLDARRIAQLAENDRVSNINRIENKINAT